MRPLDTDIWRIGVARAAAGAILAAGSLEGVEIGWLPEERPFAYLADPFGLWRDGALHVFAEAYDYRTRHGAIDVLRLDDALGVVERRTCLAEPWHLSYPQVFEADGETWLLPEAYGSGVLTLYRARAFPHAWEAVARLPLDAPAIDATPFRHEGRWWLAYAPGGDRAARQGRLHLAWADRLTGPWTPHAGNPVRIDRAGARPGGSVVTVDGAPVLPVQDCSGTYGGALRGLRIVALTPERFEATVGLAIVAPASAGRWRDGLHTLAAAGPVTLIDVKRIDRSFGGRAIDAARIGRRLLGR